jgi:hypothetical protein
VKNADLQENELMVNIIVVTTIQFAQVIIRVERELRMLLNDFTEKINAFNKVVGDEDAIVVIPVEGPSISGHACVEVDFVSAGFDWDKGKIFLNTTIPLKKAVVPNGLSVFEYEYLSSARRNGFKYICRHPSGMVIISKEIPKRTPRGWNYNKSMSETTKLFNHGLTKLTWENGGVMSIKSLLDGDM